MSSLAQPLFNALCLAAGMFWNMLWALVLGFALSGVVMAFVPKSRIARALGKSTPSALGLALFYGAASSSCSYAAAAMMHRLFRKGAHIIPALAFMLASTNLVIELSAVLWILMGWQFVAAEFLGGILLVAVMAVLMNLLSPLAEFDAARVASGESDPDADSDTLADWRRLDGWRDVARAFVSEWKMLWKDILLGVAISGALMAWVPDAFWRSLFAGGPLANALIGPLVSVLSFVCSVGNIPMAAALYHGGISFGGAISFIYADLIIIPLILIYRKYFGWKLALWITGTFYVSMVVAGVAIEYLFGALHWIPERAGLSESMAGMGMFAINYTFWLNLAFIAIGAILFYAARSAPATAEPDCCHGD